MIESFVFAVAILTFGFVTVWFAEARKKMTTTVTCKCGRRKVTAVFSGPNSIACSIELLTGACFWCKPDQSQGEQSVQR